MTRMLLASLVALGLTRGQILDEFRRSYVLLYSPQGVRSQGWHTVTVSVPAQPALTVKSRSGYFGS